MKNNVFKPLLLLLSGFMLTGCVMYNGRNKDGTPKGDNSTSSSTNSDGTSESASSSSDSEDESSSSSEELTPPPEGNVNIYLVLGPNGLYEGAAGSNIAAKYLQNAVALTLPYGEALPDGSKVTSTVTGSSFSHWVDRNTTDRVTSVTVDSTITEQVLVAVFSGGEGGNIPITPDDGLPSSGYGFLFSDHTKENPHYYTGADAPDNGDYKQKKIPDFQMIAGQKFQIYDFEQKAGWTVPLDPASCGGDPDRYISVVSPWYTVLETFNAKDIYLKLKLGADQLYIGKEKEEDGLPDEGYGFLFKTEAGVEPYYKVATYTGKDGDYDQYKVDNFRLVQGQQFQLYNFADDAGWVVDLDPYSCGANGDASIVSNYITKGASWYTVVQTFDAKDIYIKFKMNADQLYIGLDDGTPTPDPVIATTLYIKPNSDWASDSAKFALYFPDETWSGFGVAVPGVEGCYSFDNSSKYTQIIIVRLDPTATTPNWESKYNQTPGSGNGFINVPTNGDDLATLGDGWDGASVSWSKISLS